MTEFYPKQKPTLFCDETGYVKSSIVAPLIVIVVLAFMFSIFVFFMDVSDLPVFETPIFDIDKYIEHRKNFLNELSGLTCSELATNIASDTYSNYGGKAFSDAALAQLEYNYECLGVARPAYNQTNFVAENPRSDR